MGAVYDAHLTCNTVVVMTISALCEGATSMVLSPSTHALNIMMDTHLLPWTQYHHFWPVNVKIQVTDI